MKHKVPYRLYYCMIYLLAIFFSSCTSNDSINYEMKDWELTINSKGQIIHILNKNSHEDYCVDDTKSALISLKLDSTILFPVKADVSNGTELITFYFENGIQADVRVKIKDKYLTFELFSISDDSLIDAVIWGPYHVRINESIGETIGIVQNNKFTLGLQALNLKTLGGYPWNDNDHLPQLDIFEQDNFEDLGKGKRGVLYSVEAAKPTDFGSSLQAYTRNRKKERIIENWRHDQYLASSYDDGGIVGSKIALFGCKTDSTLHTIGLIEKEEGLPHPVINGEWIKTSPIINSSYLIMDFNEKNIEACLKYSIKSGFGYLYHGHPFESWGHFSLIKSKFPNGWDGMKECVRKAEAQGIFIGTHTLTNFINTNDSYVTPVPDHRLAKVGSSTIVQNIDDAQTEIEIENPIFFNQFKNNNLQSVVIDEEVIRYGSVTENAPWILKDCIRGAFGTRASDHLKGSKINKLADHGYKVFLGDVSLNKELAENIADFMNQTGVRMLDFDGLEGTHSTGMGNYGEVLFAQQWYDHLNSNIKNHFLLGASRPGHYFWHIYSRMNWGEPWYAGFRESQTEYRLLNQKYFKRNLMPGMLGWFKMTSSTSVEDIEWLMTRSAAYNAGFAFVTDLVTLAENGNTEEIFSILNTWETARLNGIFTEDQMRKMQDLSTEFHLEKNDQNVLLFTQKYSYKFQHEKKIRQPGEPLFSTFNFENLSNKQPLNFIITAVHSDLSNISIEINNHKTTELSISLKKGQTIKYRGNENAIIYDQNWNVINTVPINRRSFIMEKGNQSITFDCIFQKSDEEAMARIEFILYDLPDKIISN
ncbi:MAG: hypothetical protein ABFS38_08180 [Bacteroidota bacterium]